MAEPLIENISQRLLPVPRQLIRRGPAPVGEIYFGEFFYLFFSQRLTIIESPTPDDYDYYDEFSQACGKSFNQNT